MRSDESLKGVVWLVYDGECPVCKAYCRRARIRNSVGELHLIDAREPSELMDEITVAGLDIDQGMVVKFNNVLYYGPQAMTMLTLLSTPSGWFNRISYTFFGGERRSRLFYPLGKFFRNMVLKLLGIRYIENLKKSTPEFNTQDLQQ